MKKTKNPTEVQKDTVRRDCKKEIRKGGNGKRKKLTEKDVHVSCRIDKKTAIELDRAAKEKNKTRSEEIRDRLTGAPKQIEKSAHIITKLQVRSEELIRYIEEKYDSAEDYGLQKRKEALCAVTK